MFTINNTRRYNMIYIYEGGSVIFDGSTLTEEEKNNAIVVANKPSEEFVEGKYSILKWDVEKQTAWYEYEDIPKTSEELLREEMIAMQEAIDFIIMGGM